MHGTDTLAYTASALSFMLENLRKTVIVTGYILLVVQFDTIDFKCIGNLLILYK